MKIKAFALLALFAVVSTPAFSQAQSTTTIQDLLRRVEQGRVSESREARQREQQFLSDRNNQRQLLNQVQGQLRQAEQRSEQLERTLQDNRQQIAALRDQLNERLGSLRDLFGTLQTAAGDAASFINASIYSAQVPGRAEFLETLARRMGNSDELASIEDIQRLQSIMMQEMAASADVVNFAAQIQTDAGAQDAQVTRVGLFNLVSDGQYYQYRPTSENGPGQIIPFASQPPARFTDTVSNLLSASSGLVPFAIDPIRGERIALYLQEPTLLDRIKQGGTVGYIIIAVGVFALLLALFRLIVLAGVGSKVKRQTKAPQAQPNNPLGRVMMAYEKNKQVDTDTLELKLNEAILKETPALTRSVTLLKIIAVVAPLMGLLGTVTGMINTFQAIMLFGTGDPKTMAGGISQALVTTVLGLCVAIPVTLLHSIVNTRSRNIIHVLEEQSAGLVAAHHERQKG